MLLELAEKNPFDAAIIFECAVVHDNLALENEAIPLYEKAIRLGLSDENLELAFLGLGSSYRCVQDFEKSSKVLEEGAKRFPANWGIKTFLAMTYHMQGRHGAAMRLLLQGLSETSTDPSIQYCKTALGHYAEEFGAGSK